jgi:hypothetical protein
MTLGRGRAIYTAEFSDLATRILGSEEINDDRAVDSRFSSLAYL